MIDDELLNELIIIFLLAYIFWVIVEYVYSKTNGDE